MRLLKYVVFGFCFWLLSVHLFSQNYTQNFLRQLEHAIMEEMNLARTNPQLYIGFLKNYKKSHRGNHLNHSFDTFEYTKEGTAAVDEAIRFLTDMKPMKPLIPSRGMHLGARDLGQSQSKHCYVGHRSIDGSYCKDRVSRYGEWRGGVAENLCYGKDKARLIVLGLIVDDGIPNRTHRNNIFNRNHTYAGVYTDTHCRYRILMVSTFANGYKEK